ncbi:MAG: PEP-CTERM sorting domain-containing protein [Planctomycetia bacterium]|nr:MAG: PEP-CTERM sorting domain-containing protein [Planctomycetia bacterium]
MRALLSMTAVLCSAAIALGDVTYFTNHAAFTDFVSVAGKQLKGVETFEESLVGAQAKIPFPNSLQHGVPQPTFPNGIDATNLIIQTNITPGPFAAQLNPSASPNALWVNGPGFLGSNSVKVGTDEFLDGLFSSLDLIFTSHDKTAIGVDISTYPGFNAGHNGFFMAVFDTSNVLLGTFVIPGMTPTEPAKNFFGVWSPVPIGRVNIWGRFDIPQPFAVDNIEMWVPEPTSAALLGTAAALLLRRRR